MENFGRYRILERLGADALGELLRARDTRVGRTVALRIISPIVVGGPGRRDALMADASAARALSHPHVAALFDAGEEDGRVFLAHEYVTGRSLRGNVMGKPLSASRTIEFAIQIADGVAEGHRLGLVHAGLDPSTVFITDKDKAKIVDFGLAAWTSAGLRRRAVTEQLAGGKAISARGAGDVARWMSPEQNPLGPGRCTVGRLLPRRDRLPDGDGAKSVRGSRRGGGGDERPSTCPPSRFQHQSRSAREARCHPRPGHGEEPRRAIPVGRGDGGGPAGTRRLQACGLQPSLPIIPASLSMSMFAPDTMTAVVRDGEGILPSATAATPTAPAPSETR